MVSDITNHLFYSIPYKYKSIVLLTLLKLSVDTFCSVLKSFLVVYIVYHTNKTAKSRCENANCQLNGEQVMIMIFHFICQSKYLKTIVFSLFSNISSQNKLSFWHMLYQFIYKTTIDTMQILCRLSN